MEIHQQVLHIHMRHHQLQPTLIHLKAYHTRSINIWHHTKHNWINHQIKDHNHYIINFSSLHFLHHLILQLQLQLPKSHKLMACSNLQIFEIPSKGLFHRFHHCLWSRHRRNLLKLRELHSCILLSNIALSLHRRVYL